MANDIKLGDDHPVTEDLKPLKVGGQDTSIETAKHGKGALVNGDLGVRGVLKAERLQMPIVFKSANKDNHMSIYPHNDSAGTGIRMQGDASGNEVLMTTGSNAALLITNDGASGNGNFGVTFTGEVSIESGTNQNSTLKTNGTGNIVLNAGSGVFQFYDTGDTDDSFKITVVGGTGATTLETVSADADGHLFVKADGHVEFDGCGVGFDLVAPTYNASDTNVDFTTGNKQQVTFGSGNITDLNLIFPKVSGNFVLLLKQDGTGSRTVTNYKVWDRTDSVAAGGSATVKFAGGSNPTLTTDANHIDIISIFYDGDAEIAYGVASLDFQF